MQDFHYYLRPHPQDPHYLARSTIVAALSELAPTVKGNMIDLGSGHSRGYEGLFKAYVREYLCIDWQYAENVDLCADCYDIPLPDAYADTILSTQMLEHLVTPERMLKEAHRLLKPGGSLILTAPMVWGLHEEPIDFYRYTEYGLRYLLQHAGYRDISIQPLEGLFAVLLQMVIDEYYVTWLAKHQRFAGYLMGTLNRLASWLDRVFPTRRLCLTYLATAVKPNEGHIPLPAMTSQLTQLDAANQSPLLYDEGFFDSLLEGARTSARRIVPMLLEWFEPNSVVDVGCGLGAWLAVFQEFGLQDCVGIDGDYVDRKHLQIPLDSFLAKDLAQPLKLDRRFDLALSLEVAEHLPAESASVFVDSLVRLADVVLFSAAIPFQGGTGHINEQWLGYWIKLFQQHNYVAIDCLRYRLWGEDAIEPWYLQNSLLFVKSEQLEDYPHLPKADTSTTNFPLEIIHPIIYQNSLNYYTEPLKREIAQLQAALEISQKNFLATHAELLTAKAEIAAMQTSKFWRLRSHWFRLKQWIKRMGD